MIATSLRRPLVHPLDDFYSRGQRPLPSVQAVDAAEVPEPYRSLLVHDRDMTRTLESFHQGQIHLRVLSSYHFEDAYWRESILELDGSDRPVEYGAIQIHLDVLPEASRREILAEHRPLGGILNASGLTYHSRPTAFLRIQADDFIRRAFGLSTAGTLYGRQNTLRTEAGDVIAEIIEILPP